MDDDVIYRKYWLIVIIKLEITIMATSKAKIKTTILISKLEKRIPEATATLSWALEAIRVP
jgi:hypothetical protein